MRSAHRSGVILGVAGSRYASELQLIPRPSRSSIGRRPPSEGAQTLEYLREMDEVLNETLQSRFISTISNFFCFIPSISSILGTKENEGANEGRSLLNPKPNLEMQKMTYSPPESTELLKVISERKKEIDKNCSLLVDTLDTIECLEASQTYDIDKYLNV